MMLVPKAMIGAHRKVNAVTSSKLTKLDGPPVDAEAFGELVDLGAIPAIPGRRSLGDRVLGVEALPEPSIILTETSWSKANPGNHVRVYALFKIVFRRPDYGDWLGWMLDAPWRLLSFALQGDALLSHEEHAHLEPVFLEAALAYAPQLDRLGQRFGDLGEGVKSYSEKNGPLHRIAARALGSGGPAAQLRAIEEHLGFGLLDR